MKILKWSHSAEKLKREDTLGILALQFAADIKKLDGGPFEGETIWKKVAQYRKKLKEGALQSRPLSQMLENVSG